MLNDIKNHSIRKRRSVFEECQDLQMALVELGPTGIVAASKKCGLGEKQFKKLARMGKALNHIEYEDKWGPTYEITDRGIDSLSTWIAIERLGLKETVVSNFDIDSEPFDKMGIDLKKPYLSGKKTHEIYNYSREKPYRSYLFITLDVLRVLRKHNGEFICLNKLMNEANLSGTTSEREEVLGYLSEKELLTVSKKGVKTLLYQGVPRGNTVVNALDGYAYEHKLEPIIPTHVRPKGWTGRYLRELDQYHILRTVSQSQKK
jgi:predicted transcriptional regulator